MKPSKRELWREVERLDEEIPPADGDLEESVRLLEMIFEDDPPEEEKDVDSEATEELAELQAQAEALYGDDADGVDPDPRRE
jgi:hypothetical protein